ncbi:MAG: hypothetical protein WCP73_08980 [Eubacteriales bacterium]
MIIKLFVEAENQRYAENELNDAICVFQNKIKVKEITKNEPYWKMSGVYLVEAKIDFIQEITKDFLHRFLNSISDNWQFFGDPVNQAVSSDSADGQTYLQKGIKMINVYY